MLATTNIVNLWKLNNIVPGCLSQFTLQTDCVTVMKFTQNEIAFKGYDNM